VARCAHHDSDTAVPCPLDRINRRFKADRPNQLWVSDFTYVSTWQGWLYVAFVIDVFARRIVGWRDTSSMQTNFVLDALEQATMPANLRGSWQAKTVASLAIIGKSLNHKNQNTTAIYARLNLDSIRDSVNTATSAMLAAAGLKTSADVVKIRQKKA
jgi:transposase InsO family protein